MERVAKTRCWSACEGRGLRRTRCASSWRGTLHQDCTSGTIPLPSSWKGSRGDRYSRNKNAAAGDQLKDQILDDQLKSVDERGVFLQTSNFCLGRCCVLLLTDNLTSDPTIRNSISSAAVLKCRQYVHYRALRASTGIRWAGL